MRILGYALSVVDVGAVVLLAAAAYVTRGPDCGPGLVDARSERLPHSDVPIEFDFEVVEGETVVLRLTERNSSGELVKYTNGLADPHFYVRDVSNCKTVWAHPPSGVLAIAVGQELGPLAERVMEVEWMRQDKEGRPVGPGRYLARVHYRVEFLDMVGDPPDDRLYVYVSPGEEIDARQ